jgi:hypothetical protein
MTMKVVKREEFKLDGDTVTHTPSGKWYSAYPGMPDISNENIVDVGDYKEYEIKEMAARILAERLKKD